MMSIKVGMGVIACRPVGFKDDNFLTLGSSWGFHEDHSSSANLRARSNLCQSQFLMARRLYQKLVGFGSIPTEKLSPSV